MNLQKILISALIVCLGSGNPASGTVSGNDGQGDAPEYSLDDFSISLNSLLSPPNHLWVMSGWSTVNPVSNTVAGVGDCYGPPYAGRDFKLALTIEADGHLVKDAGSIGKGDVGLLYSGGVWRPDRIVRYGTYNYIVDGHLISFSAESELVPLFGRTGFLLKLTIGNRTSGELSIKVIPEILPGKPSVTGLDRWTFGQPPKGNDAVAYGEDRWGNESADILLVRENNDLSVPAGEFRTAWLSVVFTGKGGFVTIPSKLQEWEQETKDAWERRLSVALKNIPVIHSSVPGMDDYYKRSLASGLVCIWENPAFAVNPFISTLGIDGGGICSYLWDFGGYSPQITTLMLGTNVINNARAMSAIDLSKYYAYAPDGTGIGVSYSYSVWSFVNLVWAIWKQCGMETDLYNEAKRLVLENEERQSPVTGLIDYGVQHNLLEMRSAGWEHFVASPNAERAWCLDRLADMAVLSGRDTDLVPGWRKQAESIRRNVRKYLWNSSAGWFDCFYPDGHRETIYSIQVYDALRAGVCNKQMEEALLSHLRDGAFLFPYGITSISAEDKIHYEVLDTDWSGGGAYTGEGPELALILYEQRKPELAMKILERFFWMGKHLPYYPQEHYADRPAVPQHKRANEISGMAGAQAIIFGMSGFSPEPDGSLWLRPQFPANIEIEIEGLGWKQKRIDMSVRNGIVSVRLDGKTVYSGKQKEIWIL